ncbi:MAG: hypothetical protein ACOC44_20380 [Promethearchaeia archaeon]
MIYYEFALTLMVLTVIMGLFYAISTVSSILFNIDDKSNSKAKVKGVETKNSEKTTSNLISMNLNIEKGLEPRYDILYPIINFTAEIVRFDYLGFSINFIMSFFEVQVKFGEAFWGAIDNFFNLNFSDDVKYGYELVGSLGEIMAITGGFVGVHGMILAGLEGSAWTKRFIIGMVSYIGGILLWLALMTDDWTNPPRSSIFFGAGLGFLVSCAWFLSYYKWLKNRLKRFPKFDGYMEKVENLFSKKYIKVLGGLSAFLNALDLELKIVDLLTDIEKPDSQIFAETMHSVAGGILSMIFAMKSISLFSGKNYFDKKKATKIYIISTAILSIIFFTLGFIKLNSENQSE